MVESSVYRNGQCHPERYRSTQRYNTVRPSLPILKKCRWFGYTLELFVLIFKKKKTVIKGSGFSWREARTVQGNPNPVFGIMEFFMAVFGILGFGIGNPKRRIQNPGLSCIPLKGATEKAMLSPQKTGIHWWLCIFIWSALLAMIVAFGETLISRGT